jgi:hypothetical protein
LELSKNKRSLNEARKELDMMRKKTREMESLVSIIQRGWSQLDIDTSLLLDGLADPEVEIPEPTSDLLKSFIHCSDKYLFQDPTNLSSFPSLQAKIDQWSSSKDIENTKNNLLSSLPNVKEEKEKESGSASSSSLRCFTEEIEEHLSNHISFTFSILERLCYALNDGGSLISSTETLKTLQELKESRSKETLLNDSILKLQSNLLEMECKYCISENIRNKVEKSLDKSFSTIRELEEKLTSNSNNNNNTNSLSSLSDGISLVKTENSSSSSSEQNSSNGHCHSHDNTLFLKKEENKEILEQITILEKQLMESETAKAEAEMQLTERIARPFTIQQDQQVSDLRKAMEEIRSQGKSRINSLLMENDTLSEKIKDLSFALNEVENNASKKIELFLTSFEKELIILREEKASLESKVRSFQPLNSLEELNKILFKEVDNVEDSKQLRILSLEKELKIIKDSLQLIQKNIEKSRKRERYLESVILHFAIPLPSNAKPRQSSSHSNSSNTNSNSSSSSLF